MLPLFPDFLHPPPLKNNKTSVFSSLLSFGLFLTFKGRAGSEVGANTETRGTLSAAHIQICEGALCLCGEVMFEGR